VKFRFIEETNWVPQVGVFPLLEVPSGSSRENLGTGHLQGFLPVWLQKSWGDWTAYGGGGYGINSFAGHRNWNLWAACCKKQVLTNVLIGAEVYHQTQLQVDFPNRRHRVQYRHGHRFQRPASFAVSAGRSIDGPTISMLRCPTNSRLIQFVPVREQAGGGCGQMDPTAGSAFGLARGGHDAGSQADGAVASALVGRKRWKPRFQCGQC